MLETIRERNRAIQEYNAKRIAGGEVPIPKCVVNGCKELRDATPGLGMDTTCPYHRLLFDYWLYEVCEDINRYKTRQGRRSAVTRWVKSVGKERCDKIVDDMSNSPINWKC